MSVLTAVVTAEVAAGPQVTRTQGETVTKRPTKLADLAFDIRSVIGGAVRRLRRSCAWSGGWSPSRRRPPSKTGGINLNLWAGLGMLVVAAAFIAWVVAQPAPRRTTRRSRRPSTTTRPPTGPAGERRCSPRAPRAPSGSTPPRRLRAGRPLLPRRARHRADRPPQRLLQPGLPALRALACRRGSPAWRSSRRTSAPSSCSARPPTARSSASRRSTTTGSAPSRRWSSWPW